MKKQFAFLALLLAVLLLAACGQHEHQWNDATCTEPETCSVCGETRGEALGHRWKSGGCTEPEICVRCGETNGEAPGHDWQPATCTAPETCAVCGETRGETAGHSWQPATCTAPETCAVCGETQGEALGHDAAPADYWSASVCTRCGEELAPALTPDFVAYGLDAHLIEQGKTYDYSTVCYDDESFSTVGKATVTSHTVTPGDGEKLEIRDGYSWHVVTFEVVFDDDNAYNYGISPDISYEDYYDIRHHDDTMDYDDETGRSSFDIVFKGVTYRGIFFLENSYSGWSGHSNTWTCSFYLQLPDGYDGAVVGLIDGHNDWGDGDYVFDLDNSGSLFFRLS